MVDSPEPDCWLHADVEVRRSAIEGLGLFATRSIAVGTVVSRLGGQFVSGQQLADLFAATASDPRRPYIDTITVENDLHLVLPPRQASGPGRQAIGYGNHSCDPNLWWMSPYELAVRRPVSAGDELTNDYAMSTAEPGFVMQCSCGSPLCRRVITGDDWRRAELRERYEQHWVPALLTRIRAT
ncbi:MAG: SET domain-containing protein-lysine N-methyltransferase [Nocardiopsaceae bacterium]|nr:SET domain-containing protein-lysine N-methyltransferase [Nocardiopsaceae bacterium]